MAYLTSHAHACLVDHQLVFLDLRNDRYSCLDPDDSERALRLLQAGRDGAGDAPSGRVARLLLEQGLITFVRSQGRRYSPPPRSTLAADLMGYHLGTPAKIGTAHVLGILSAALLTALRLRWQPLHAVVRRVERRNRGQRKTSPSREPTQERAHQLVQVFKRLRPLLFSARNRCLYDSLVLLEFLARYGCHPECVIGVRMGPFAAHCWVEQDGVVYNDAVAKVAAFTPIMVF